MEWIAMTNTGIDRRSSLTDEELVHDDEEEMEEMEEDVEFRHCRPSPIPSSVCQLTGCSPGSDISEVSGSASASATAAAADGKVSAKNSRQRHLSAESSEEELMFVDEALRKLSIMSEDDLVMLRRHRRSSSSSACSSPSNGHQQVSDSEPMVLWDLGTALRRLSEDVGAACPPPLSLHTPHSVLPRRPGKPGHAPLSLLKHTVQAVERSGGVKRASMTDVKSFSLDLLISSGDLQSSKKTPNISTPVPEYCAEDGHDAGDRGNRGEDDGLFDDYDNLPITTTCVLEDSSDLMLDPVSGVICNSSGGSGDSSGQDRSSLSSTPDVIVGTPEAEDYFRHQSELMKTMQQQQQLQLPDQLLVTVEQLDSCVGDPALYVLDAAANSCTDNTTTTTAAASAAAATTAATTTAATTTAAATTAAADSTARQCATVELDEDGGRVWPDTEDSAEPQLYGDTQRDSYNDTQEPSETARDHSQSQVNECCQSGVMPGVPVATVSIDDGGCGGCDWDCSASVPPTDDSISLEAGASCRHVPGILCAPASRDTTGDGSGQPRAARHVTFDLSCRVMSSTDSEASTVGGSASPPNGSPAPGDDGATQSSQVLSDRMGSSLNES